MSRSLKALSLLATALMYAVLMMGALVTNTGSGQGCGEHWPLCKGTFMPDWDYAAIIEFSHRAVSGLAGIVVVALAAWTWHALRERRYARWLAATSVISIVVQGALGAMAVIWPQPKAILAIHFGISLICFSAVLLVTVMIFQENREGGSAGQTVTPQFQRWVWWVTIFSFGVVYLGAYVRHMRASLACMGWPLCNGELIPTLYGPVGANFVHRVGAALLVVLVIRLAVMARQESGRPDLILGANLALFLVLLQVAEGALMALGYFNLLTQMVHSAIVTAFWGALTYLALRVAPSGTGTPVNRPMEVSRPVPSH